MTTDKALFSIWWALPDTALAPIGSFLLPGTFYLWRLVTSASTRSFERKPRTFVAATPEGRRVFTEHVAALKSILNSK